MHAALPIVNNQVIIHKMDALLFKVVDIKMEAANPFYFAFLAEA